MSPLERVWTPHGTDPAVVVKWLAENSPADRWTARALFVPHKGHFDAQPPAIVKYGENKNIGSNKSPSVILGGTVLAHAPDVQLLGYAEQAADGQLLGVTAWPSDEVPGWAAAKNALNLATGERGPAVPDEIATAISDLHDAGYNGYHNTGAFYKAKFDPPTRILVDAGYSYGFVAGYLLALGAPAGRLGDALKKIYR